MMQEFIRNVIYQNSTISGLEIYLPWQSEIALLLFSSEVYPNTRMHGGPLKNRHLHSHLRISKRLKGELPEHLLSRSELPETILMFAVAQRSGVRGLWCIYYLHNSDALNIYFLFVPSNAPHTLCLGTCVLSYLATL